MDKILKKTINKPIINNGAGTERTETEKEMLTKKRKKNAKQK